MIIAKKAAVHAAIAPSSSMSSMADGAAIMEIVFGGRGMLKAPAQSSKERWYGAREISVTHWRENKVVEIW